MYVIKLKRGAMMNFIKENKKEIFMYMFLFIIMVAFGLFYQIQAEIIYNN